VPSVPDDNGVVFEVAHVHELPLLLDGGVRSQDEPADVREQEAPSSVVRVCVCLREAVVHAVVQDPHENIALQQHTNRVNAMEGNNWSTRSKLLTHNSSKYLE